MTPRRLSIRLRHAVRHSRLVQIGLMVGFWFAGEAAVKFLRLPVPGGVAGMLIVLALLSSRRLSLCSMRRGAQWFLSDILLFVVPAALAVLQHRELWSLLGLKILAVIGTGTLTVMIATALTVDLCYRWRCRHGSGCSDEP